MATKSGDKRHRGSSSSSGEIEAVIYKLAAARYAEQTVGYTAAEQAHQNLMPELGDRLRVLRAMEMASGTPNGASSK